MKNIVQVAQLFFLIGEISPKRNIKKNNIKEGILEFFNSQKRAKNKK
jgi:hypothetical protein